MTGIAPVTTTEQGGLWLAATVILPLAGWAGMSGAALAANCGLPGPGGLVICTSGANPYAGGIDYTNPGTIVLQVDGDVVITRTPGDNNDAIVIREGTAAALEVDLASGVKITTSGQDADGVELYGLGNLTINSAADITIDVTGGVPPPNGTSGLIAWNPLAGGGLGDIKITQAAGTKIIATGDNGGGIYGLNYGVGTVTLTASGFISTNGSEADAVLADTEGALGGSATVYLNQTSEIITYGDESAAGYSLNKGLGDALVFADGKITTYGLESTGIVTSVQNNLSLANSQVVLSSTATIDTTGVGARGVFAHVGAGTGQGTAGIISAGKVTTQGSLAFGLYARIDALTNTKTASILLQSGGSVATGGESAFGLFSNHRGTNGVATLAMQANTTVTTTGKLANGVYGLSGLNGLTGGTVSFAQAPGATVTVSGQEAFGVYMDGATSAAATLGGPVTATGEFGVGAASNSAAGTATLTIGAGVKVAGGWQADLGGFGPTTGLPSAGVLMGAGLSSQLTNAGSISALSDRAIADFGRKTPTPGNLTVDNSGLVTGFVELAAGGTNVFNNTGLFDVRHFADTTGNGIRDTKRVSISDFGAASSSFNNASGATVRLAPVVGETTVDPLSYYVPTTGFDSRALEASNYTLARSGIVQGQFLNLGTFNNAGVIDLRGSAIGNTLVMTDQGAAGNLVPGTGIFRAEGGTLLLNTFFNEGIPLGGQTGSLSDVLVVDSTQLGAKATGITIDRRQGPGAVTPGNGILLVEVRNKAASAAGVFALNGDFIADGQQMVVGGAHRYGLFHNGVDVDIADGNWYLRNLGQSPIVPIYEDYPKVLLPLVDPPTLQQRVGNRYWNQPAAPRTPQTVFCKDASQNYRCVVTDAQASYYLDESGTMVSETTGIWGRISGQYGRYNPPLSTSGAQYDSTLWGLQAGMDGLISEGESGKLIGGLTINYGRTSANVTAVGSAGNITSNAYGLGGTLTWYGASGFYVDGQAQLAWLDSHLSSLTTGRSLVDGNRGFGYALSVEAGQRVALDDHWTLTPQAQLTYSSVGFDSFTDVYGTTVSLVQGQSLNGRLGLAAEYQSSWKAEDGSMSRVSSYGIANLEKELLDGTRVNVSGYEFASRDNGLWGGLGLGGTYNWDDDKYSIYGEVSAHTGLERFGNSVEYAGTVGFRVKW